MRDDYRALIGSQRVSRGTRKALEDREGGDDANYLPQALSAAAFATLRALVDQVLPQREPRIDIAARLDRQLAGSQGDGWRAALLPPDAAAYRQGLHTLEAHAQTLFGLPYTALDARHAQSILEAIAGGKRLPQRSDLAEPILGSDQARAWFADLRADAVKIFVSHPETLARLGYSGFANGGDGQPKSGFTSVGLGEREPWEPATPPARVTP